MPLYEYRCHECGQTMDAVRTVEDRYEAPLCKCGGDTYKIISAYKVHKDLDPYYDDNLEAHIESKAHRRRVMKEQGVEEHFGQGWHTSPIRTRKV